MNALPRALAMQVFACSFIPHQSRSCPPFDACEPYQWFGWLGGGSPCKSSCMPRPHTIGPASRYRYESVSDWDKGLAAWPVKEEVSDSLLHVLGGPRPARVRRRRDRHARSLLEGREWGK